MDKEIGRTTCLEIGGAATGVATGGGTAAHTASDDDALLLEYGATCSGFLARCGRVERMIR